MFNYMLDTRLGSALKKYIGSKWKNEKKISMQVETKTKQAYLEK